MAGPDPTRIPIDPITTGGYYSTIVDIDRLDLYSYSSHLRGPHLTTAPTGHAVTPTVIYRLFGLTSPPHI